MPCAVAPNALARVGSPNISVTLAPTRCAPINLSSASKMSFTKPSRSPAAVALPDAVKGNRPTLYSIPASRAFCYVTPTDATSGEVNMHDGTVE